ncbi:hypothetical protein F511_11578 [Dorcoceras hygrometricum]|uniref:Uncharacterized protein n=1 Tax=Dorcoceras hygrometricum TaxID=472368 RepID=A0A2Z7D7P0_9LAMI|nr:hypothetical protein F511_11578 [Dorcoceras hygrometricum]
MTVLLKCEYQDAMLKDERVVPVYLGGERKSYSDRSGEEIPSVKSSSSFLVQTGEGIGIPVVDQIRRPKPPNVEVRFPREICRSQVPRRYTLPCARRERRSHPPRTNRDGYRGIVRVSRAHDAAGVSRTPRTYVVGGVALPSCTPHAHIAASVAPVGRHPCVHVAHDSARHRRPTCANWSRRWLPLRAHTLRTGARTACITVAARVRKAAHRPCGGFEADMRRRF